MNRVRALSGFISDLAVRLNESLRGRRGLRSVLDVPLVSLGIRVGSLLFVFLVLERWLLRVARLPETSYGEPLIAVELARAFLARSPAALSLLLRIGVITGLAYVLARHFRRV